MFLSTTFISRTQGFKTGMELIIWVDSQGRRVRYRRDRRSKCSVSEVFQGAKLGPNYLPGGIGGGLLVGEIESTPTP